MSVLIVDYGMGNIKSVINALKYLGHEPEVVSEPKFGDEKVIIPGVGSFGDAMENLKEFSPEIKRVMERGIPVLGICLGMQAFFETSDESPEIKGLSKFNGRVAKVDTEFSLPHIGWNSLKIKKKECPLFRGLREGYAYYVHSYHAIPENSDIIAATSSYGAEVTGAIWEENVFGTQFHPEKSGKFGLKILENFLEL